jgi:hypothetical protein
MLKFWTANMANPISPRNNLPFLGTPAVDISTGLFDTKWGQFFANVFGVVGSATSLSQALDNNFGASKGTLLVRGAGGWTALTPGPAGTKLTSQGPGNLPDWT